MHLRLRRAARLSRETTRESRHVSHSGGRPAAPRELTQLRRRRQRWRGRFGLSLQWRPGQRAGSTFISARRSSKKTSADSGLTFAVWTIGHSTRSAQEFRAVLHAYEIELLADVRRFPASRRLPQFASATVQADVARDGLSYRWIPSLGGRRRPDPESINLAWRHASFRAYADHLASEEFADGLTELLMLANGLRTAVMCAELLWWRCHRRLIADVLVAIGVPTIHIRDRELAEPHRLAPPARLVRGVLTYAQPHPREANAPP